MKKLILFLLFFISFAGARAQSCNYNYTQSGFTVNFQLPLFPLIYTVDSVLWQFGDGFSSFQVMGGITMNTPHTYLASGTYNACLTVWLTMIGSTTPIVCQSCQLINVGGTTTPCNASFLTSISGNTVALTSTSSGPGPITSHTWTFGDGSPPSSLTNPAHTYTAAGTYIICHTISGIPSTGTTPFQCTTCDTIVISGGGTPCNASFTSTTSGSTVNFTSTSTGPGPITSHSWTFGDGSPASTLTNPSHTYAAPGQYNVCHTITGSTSAGTFTCTHCDSVVISGPSPCNAAFVFTQSGPMVACTATSSGPGPITSHLWNFGDGTPPMGGPNPVHTYASPGTYVLCHTIMGTVTGSTSTYSCTTCDTVVISGPPPAGCVATAGFTHTAMGGNAAFTNTSTCAGCVSTSYTWNFGDGSPTTTVPSPVHTFPSTGTFTVCLYMTGVDSLGNTCLDTVCKPIMIVTSVEDWMKGKFSLYPNPVQQRATITTPSGISFTKVEALDMMGRSVPLLWHMESQKIEIDCATWPAGIYMIRMHTPEHQVFPLRIRKE